MNENEPKRSFVTRWLPWGVVAVLFLIAAILWQPLMILLRQPDQAVLQAEVNRLGVLAPVGFLALSIIQIVGAPIPGYPVQLLGGALFGTWLGGVYSVVGMMAGGLVAAWLARTLGRPFIEGQIGGEKLRRYASLTALESVWVWALILFIPLGDFPYFIAGLSRVKYTTLALAILLSRGPGTFVISWVGETSLEFPAWARWGFVAAILVILLAGYSQRDRLSHWFDKVVLHRLT